MEAALLAVRGPEHVVMLARPAAHVRAVQDILIAALRELGFADDQVQRLHGWEPAGFWVAYAGSNGLELPAGAPRGVHGAKRSLRADRRRMHLLERARGDAFPWMRGAYVLNVPLVQAEEPQQQPERGADAAERRPERPPRPAPRAQPIMSEPVVVYRRRRP